MNLDELRGKAEAALLPRKGKCCTCTGDVDSWFDRSICPEPCGSMHDRCSTCGLVVGRGCVLDTLPVGALVIPPEVVLALIERVEAAEAMLAQDQGHSRPLAKVLADEHHKRLAAEANARDVRDYRRAYSAFVELADEWEADTTRYIDPPAGPIFAGQLRVALEGCAASGGAQIARFDCCEHCGHISTRSVPFHPWHRRGCSRSDCKASHESGTEAGE